MVEDVTREFYREGEDWQVAFAGFLAAREMGVENVSAVPMETSPMADPRSVSQPSRIPA
jgi:hypothetical protein